LEVLLFYFTKALRAFGFTKIGNIEFWAILLLTALVFVLDLLVEGWDGSSIKKVIRYKKTTRSDAYLYFLQTFKLFYVLEFLLTLGLSHTTALFKIKPFFTFQTYISNPYFLFLILFVTSDFLRYWTHRVFHFVGFLWEAHGYHHSAQEMNVFTYYRHHFLEFTFQRLLVFVPNLLLGGHVFSYLFARLLVQFIEMMQHSSIRSKWGLVGTYILVSPAAHRIHHSIDERHHNKNFSTIFIFWDRLFRTYQPYEPVTEIGLPNNNYNQKGFVYDMYLVFVLCFGELKKVLLK
jgi:sterol desaturase/sphingolipid hydroxylase (fatty acid hydroxylase superfamily)